MSTKIRWAPLRRLVIFTKKVSLPGFAGIPVYDVAAFFWKEVVRELITTRASAISFNFFLAVFPGIIFVFTLMAYIPITNMEAVALSTINSFLPKDFHPLVDATVQDIISIQRGGLLSVGFLAALLFATNGMGSIMNTFDKSYRTFRQRGFFHQRWVAMQLTFLLFGVLLCSITAIIMGRYLIELITGYLGLSGNLAYYIIGSLKWVGVVLMLFFSYSVIYYFGPAATKTTWRFFSPGATLATILSIVSSVGFSFYVNHFDQYNKIYGSIGTLMALLLLIWINSLVLLVGFELNTSIYVNKSIKVDSSEA